MTSDADGTPVLIKQLGDVRIGPALRFGAVTKHGEGEIVAGTVMMLTGANSREVVHAVKARLAEIQKELPEGVEIRSYYDRAEFIGRMLKTVAINLAEGALLVAVVLFLTLGSLRGALIAALAIPLSMGDRADRHGAHGRHRQPDVAGRDRLRPAGRRRDRHAGGGAGRDRACARRRRARTSRTWSRSR